MANLIDGEAVLRLQALTTETNLAKFIGLTANIMQLARNYGGVLNDQ